MEIENTKNKLRKQFLQKRDDFCSSKNVAILAKDLAKNISTVLPQKPTGFWASYRAFKNEADPALAENSAHIQWCYPVIEGEALAFYANPASEWVLNFYKIQEPAQKTKKIPVEQIEGILVPGIAFDLKGHRLGWGKAFYDKTLKNYSGKKIGVAYSIQLTDSLPHSDHDVSMNMIVTEKEAVKIQERKVS